MTGARSDCDLQAADPVAVDQRAAIAVRLGARIVERVDDVAVERFKPKRETQLAEAARRHDHAVEALTADRPSAGDRLTGVCSRIRWVTPKCSA